jgi:hypothetical protein
MAYGVILMAIIVVLALIVSLIERLQKEDLGRRKLSFWSGLGGK